MRNLPADIRLRGDEQPFKKPFADIAGLCTETDLIDVLDQKSTSTTMYFTDVFLRTLAPDRMLSNGELATPEKYAKVKHEKFALAANRTTELLTNALVVGDHARLDMALFALSERRGWPAPPPLPRIHDYGAEPQCPQREAAIAAKMRSLSPYDGALYAIARRLAQADEDRLLASAGNRSSIPDYLNARFRDRFFREAKPVLSFDLDADRAWAGYGWSPRIIDGEGRATRGIANGFTQSSDSTFLQISLVTIRSSLVASHADPVLSRSDKIRNGFSAPTRLHFVNPKVSGARDE